MQHPPSMATYRTKEYDLMPETGNHEVPRIGASKGASVLQHGGDAARSRRRIDHSGRRAALAAMKAGRPAAARDGGAESLAARLALPCEVLRSHAETLAGLGMPVAHIYVASAALSVERAILAVHAAERQEGWPAGGIAEFDVTGLADWL